MFRLRCYLSTGDRRPCREQARLLTYAEFESQLLKHVGAARVCRQASDLPRHPALEGVRPVKPNEVVEVIDVVLEHASGFWGKSPVPTSGYPAELANCTRLNHLQKLSY